MSSLWLCILGLAISQVSLVSSAAYKQTIKFSDQQKFADLSVFNFDRGLSTTYQYSLVARPGRQVTIHFLTVLTKNANVNLYDGADATARKVDTSIVNKIDNSSTELIPVQIKSTAANFYLEVTPFSSDPKVLQDFQAIATDFIQPNECGALVRAAGIPRAFPKVPIPGSPASCIHIIRGVDVTNNKDTTLNAEWVETDALTSVYKGISMSPASKLVTMRRFYVYNEKNFIFHHTLNMTLQFAYIPDEGRMYNFTSQAVSQPHQIEDFASPDFLPPRPIGALERIQHGYSFVPLKRVDTLRFNFLSKIGSANVQITYMNAFTANRTVTYTQSTLPPSLLVSDTDQLYINYSCMGTQCTGMYGTVEDATQQ